MAVATLKTLERRKEFEEIIGHHSLDNLVNLHITQPQIATDPEFNQLCSSLEKDARTMGHHYDLTTTKWALREAISNAYRHGNGGRGIDVNYLINQYKISIIVKDNAEKRCGFDMNKLMIKGRKAKESPETHQKLIMELQRKRNEKYAHKGNHGGLGLFQIGYWTDKAMAFYEHGQGNIVYLEKHRKA
jgi:anti-sigma regulatory factor (Ser/Thr protein kinase)